MEFAVSTPLSELPAFLSTISMVVDDRALIIERLIQAERKSPPRYEPAKELFCRVLQGDLSVTQALAQARNVTDPVERKCAVDILEASKKFLFSAAPAHIGLFPSMNISIPNGMQLSVSPVRLRHLNSQRLMVLHFWQTPLSTWQLSAAGAVLRAALARNQPDYSNCELDFISVSVPGATSQRRFERYSWAKLKPLNDADLSRFWKQFCTAWSEYQSKGPRQFRRKRQSDMFD